MTGEDLGYRPGVLKEAKFDYSPLGKVFNMGLDNKDDKKEGLLKRLKNIEDKNEKLLNGLSKAGENVSDESDFYFNSTYYFHRFYRDFRKFKKMASLDTKRGELIYFLNVLETLKILSPLVIIQKNLKIRL